MKKRFTILALALALLAIVPLPAYACVECREDGYCGVAYYRLRCRPTINGCYNGWPCGSAASIALASEYRIASVEITHGAEETKPVVYARK